MNKTTDEQRGYSKGYTAGQKRAEKDLKILREHNREMQSKLTLLEAKQKERVFMQCLEMAVKDCHGWTIDGQKVNNAELYCELANAFAKCAISKINQ